MSFVQAVGTSTILGGLTGIGAIGSAFVSISGTRYFCKMSEKAAVKEGQASQSPWKATMWRIAKWAAIGLAALVGTLGAAASGLYVSTFATLFSAGTLTPVAIGVGVGAAVGLELAVMATIVKQALHNRTVSTPNVAAG